MPIPIPHLPNKAIFCVLTRLRFSSFQAENGSTLCPSPYKWMCSAFSIIPVSRWVSSSRRCNSVSY